MARKEYESIGIKTDTSTLEDKVNKITAQDSNEESYSEENFYDQEIVKVRKEEVTSTAKERMDAMANLDLVARTIGHGFSLNVQEDFNFTMIAKKRGLNKNAMAREYILKAIELDIKKIGIFEHKK